MTTLWGFTALIASIFVSHTTAFTFTDRYSCGVCLDVLSAAESGDTAACERCTESMPHPPNFACSLRIALWLTAVFRGQWRPVTRPPSASRMLHDETDPCGWLNLDTAAATPSTRRSRPLHV